ncbi:MAG: hypothetical protein H0V41_05500 [Pseudonocardiales bacterium]|nr:hypothetical protein [Pseudonocardiales bacterium]
MVAALDQEQPGAVTGFNTTAQLLAGVLNLSTATTTLPGRSSPSLRR